MSRVINESDWRLFRKLEPIALDRFCERVLSEINRISSDSNKSSHQRYVDIFKLLERRDRELADAYLWVGAFRQVMRCGDGFGRSFLSHSVETSRASSGVKIIGSLTITCEKQEQV